MTELRGYIGPLAVLLFYFIYLFFISFYFIYYFYLQRYFQILALRWDNVIDKIHDLIHTSIYCTVSCNKNGVTVVAFKISDFGNVIFPSFSTRRYNGILWKMHFLDVTFR